MRWALLLAVLAAGCEKRGAVPTAGEKGGAEVPVRPEPVVKGGKSAGSGSQLPQTLARKFDGRTAAAWGRDLLDIGDPRTRHEASVALRRFGGEGLRFVLVGLRSDDATIRADAVFALNHEEAAKYPDVFLPALVPLLTDKPVATRVAAAKSIAACKFADGVPAIRSALAKETDDGVRNTFREALDSLAGKK